MSKRIMLSVTLVIVSAALLIGFIGCQKEEAATQAAGQEVVVYNSYWSDPEPKRVEAELMDMFEEQNPGVKIIHSTVAHEDFKQAIRAYLTSSTPPDVLTWFAGNRARFFIDKGLIMDISDVWEEAGWNDSYSKGFRALSTVDGKQYFLPGNWYWWAVYYSKSTFEKYDIDPPETWDEFIAVCDKLKANGVTPITIGTKYRWTAAAWFDYLNMRVNGPEFHINLMLGKESYDDPRVVKVLNDYWRPLIDKGYFIDDPASYTWAEAIPFMANGQAAMYLMGDFIRDSYPAEKVDDIDFFRFPIIDPSVPVGEDAPTDGYFIPANVQNPEMAKDLLEFFGSAETQEFIAKELKRLVTNNDVDPSVYNANQQKGVELINGADYVAQFYDRDTTPEMADKGMNGFMEFWANTDKAEEILGRLEADRKDLFTE